MNAPPKIAIVGRPNVGKSSLFNRILKRKAAIVADKEGVTRDRLCQEGTFLGKRFFLIDTGGIEDPNIPFSKELKIQSEVALEQADIILVVVDGTTGVTLYDERVVDKVRRAKKPTYLIVNKADTSDKEEEMKLSFYELGIDPVFFISCLHNRGVESLMETLLSSYEEETAVKDDRIKVAIIGRPNVGKSTLLNTLLGEERSIVSSQQGTTRDAVDQEIEKDGKKYLFIDTAGIRRRKKEKEVEDFFSHIQAFSAIERADLCLLLLDSTKGMTIEEKKLFQKIESSGKGCILLFNKWDLVKGFQMEHCLQEVKRVAPFANFVPALFISAKSGRNVAEIFSQIEQVYANLTRSITTPQLNQFFEKHLGKMSPPMIQGRRFKIFYASQIRKNPPRFVLFVNGVKLLASSYHKYLLRQMRTEFAFSGAPIFFHLKQRKSTSK